MNDLPPILISKIVDHAAEDRPNYSKPRLSPYATISKTWKQVVEAKSFSCIRITNDEITTFATCLRNKRTRQEVLRQLFLRIYSTTDTRNRWSELTISERAEESRRNDETLTTSIRGLFQSLEGWRAEARVDLYIILQAHGDHGMSSMRTEPRILEPGTLATVECVKKFVFRNHAITPTRTVVDLASRLPALQHLDWLIFTQRTGGRADDVGRVQNRVDLAAQLIMLQKHNPVLEILELSFTASTAPFGYDNIIPSILLPFDQRDHLSQSLRHLSQDMKKVSLENMTISSQLFWPQEDEGTEPQWPTLGRYKIGINPMAAEGGWWLDGLTRFRARERVRNNTPRNDEGKTKLVVIYDREVEEAERYPIWPTEELEDLLLVMVKAVAKMPVLKSFSAFVDLDHWVEDQRFGVWYLEAEERIGSVEALFDDGNDDNDAEDNLDKKRLYWSGPKEWRMSGELSQAWNRILGEDGVVRYHEW
ncbi:hypothetical protein E4T47_03584 [Aureobasidium subglaciale]|nr:hypothetical protein E4T47_03584 [Aureobasidium subglaciale]